MISIEVMAVLLLGSPLPPSLKKAARNIDVIFGEKHKELAFYFQLDNLPGHQYPLKRLEQFIYSLYSLKRKQPLRAELHSIITLILCIWHSKEPKLNTTEHLKCIHGAMKVELTPN